ncbi:MAG: NAD-dependent epimerase/dehydratase family protein [Candidatus Glassbacteria bacterium]
MRILVTGGAGFIGSHVVDRYIERGHEVTVIDNLSTGKRQNVNKDARFYEMDIQDPSLRGIFEHGCFDVVNHHAAQIDVRVSVADPIRDARTNVLGFLNIMENVKRFDVGRTILISSGGVIYGETPDEPATEVSLKRPFSPYGVTKYASEQYLFYYHNVHGIEGVTLRYSNVYGPRQDPFGEAGVVAIFSKNLLKGETLTIYGDGEQERDYVFVDDVVEANMIMTESKLSNACDSVDDLAFNVGTGSSASVNELARIMIEIAGSNSKPVYAPPRAGELLRNCLSCDRITSHFDWRVKTAFRQGLEKTYNWFAEQNI